MRLPYGISNFADLRRGGYAFADKTAYIPALESAEKGRRYLVFLRPRRMGKTLLLSMLEHYYDILAAPTFDELFGGLAIADAPTDERGRYTVLRLEMTGFTTDQGTDRLRADFHAALHGRIQVFLDHYREILPDVIAAFDAGLSTDAPASLMSRFLRAMERSPVPLYLLIDEYDNFTNDLIARGDHGTYRDLVHAAGFVREFYKAVKEGTARGVIGRIFMTGVSPVTLDDLTSGFNITSNISLHRDFNALAGFTTDDVRRLVAGVLAGGAYTLDPAALEADLRLYYNGYLFSSDAAERVWNPDMLLYFLKELEPPARYPRELLDVNVRTDHGRIQRLVFTPEGEARPDIIDDLLAVITDGSIPARIQTSFPLDRAYEGDYFISLLYYMGLLTLETHEGWSRLRIPNYAVRTLYWETIARMVEQLHHDRLPARRLDQAIEAMALHGDLGPFLSVVWSGVIRKLSNRDLIRLDEKTMKVILLSYLSLADVFFAFSEVELAFGYSDLVLLPRRSQPAAQTGFLIELKYLKSGASAAEITARLDEADAQLRRYLAEPRIEAVKPPRGFQAVSVAFVATEACWIRPLDGQANPVVDDRPPPR